MKTKLTLLLLIFQLFSCGKDNICGNDGFCAEINGKKWIPVSNDFKNPVLSAHLIDSNNQFWIGAYKGSSSLLVGVIDSVKRIGVGDYVLAGQICCSGNYQISADNSFRTNTTNSGLLSISQIDRSKKTITGKFYFKAHNAVTGEIVDISNGTFNTNYVEY